MKIAVIGVGEMGGAIVKGLLQSEQCQPANLTLSAPHQSTLDRFQGTGVRTTTDNSEAARDADIVILAVKPQVAKDVLTGLSDVLDFRKQQLISVVARLSAARIASLLHREGRQMLPIYLAVPNIAIAVKASMTLLVATNASEAQQQVVSDLFEELGGCLETTEQLLPAGTSLASCGLAYALRYIRAASEGGVELGFKAAEAQRIVVQTVKGAAALLEATGEHPEALIDQVTTAGGITIRGLNEMEHAGFSSSVIRGLKAGS